jgi:hypothetical protein
MLNIGEMKVLVWGSKDNPEVLWFKNSFNDIKMCKQYGVGRDGNLTGTYIKFKNRLHTARFAQVEPLSRDARFWMWNDMYEVQAVCAPEDPYNFYIGCMVALSKIENVHDRYTLMDLVVQVAKLHSGIDILPGNPYEKATLPSTKPHPAKPTPLYADQFEIFSDSDALTTLSLFHVGKDLFYLTFAARDYFYSEVSNNPFKLLKKFGVKINFGKLQKYVDSLNDGKSKV